MFSRVTFELLKYYNLLNFVACETGKQYPEKVTASSGWLTSPNFPNTYPFDSDCAWTFIAPNGQVQIFITLLLEPQYVTAIKTLK